MKPSSSLLTLATFGALSATATGALAQVDTSRWKCESCPFEKAAIGGTLDAGVGAVSGTQAGFGDFTGLHRNGAHLVLGGNARVRDANDLVGTVSASDLGLDTRRIDAELRQEGRYALRFGYAELPRHLATGARTPFLGGGGGTLTLPTGFPAATTGAMPLATSLQDADIGFKRRLVNLGAEWVADPQWTYRVDVKRDVRDGTQRGAGSFSANASQLPVPVDQVTDRIEASASYASRDWHATLAYQASRFNNDWDALTWSNPFPALVAGSGRGQLALAPDNQFHQLAATGGYQISPTVRASAQLAVGRSTQDAAFLDPTLNTNLGVTRPRHSLQGSVDTLNASVRLSAAATERLRVNASLSRDERDNGTPSAAYTSVATDMFVGTPRTNLPYSFTHDRFSLSADHRGPASWRGSAGAEYDTRKRDFQEVETTRETTVWAKVGARPLEQLAWSLKLAHAQRDASDYRALPGLVPAENPLLRKVNLADRRRDSAALRADATPLDSLTVGVVASFARDDYTKSSVGLTDARSVGLGVDASFAVSDDTRVHTFANTERTRSNQAGSQVAGSPDWTGRTRDSIDVLGFGVQHAALKGKLDLGADVSFSRARSEVRIAVAPGASQFPTAKTSFDSVKLHATYKLTEEISLLGSYWYERVDARDWHLDGVLPDTVPNLLAFGEQSPHYTANVVRLALRYRF